ncbi:MarR family winged helix-turn-helix transcriptional regulator [Roseomonas sp. OT10]|uniref:MarR family winged helix-turn-helix transcriptional regulator n=1 Tax=Roseomonas cutis TaxID=2897332 RepID=UPI001E555AF4|nr:MarR family winged helix-turn-helix transcriptional regulator [Roseomonas sp. OT10]UFN47185.1 MarR family winged helix-turn-helix transcriptional regulator [Roseomonas sp. OT10]
MAISPPRRRASPVLLRPVPAAPEDAAGAVVSPLAESPAFLVRLSQLRAFDEFARNFAGLSVTPAGYGVFALIVANPGIRPGVLAEELRVKPSNVATLVNALVAAGLVRRQADAAELRANQLYATEAGIAAYGEMERAHDEVDARFTERLTAAERRAFVALLRKLLHR